MNSELLNIAALERTRYFDFFIHATNRLRNGKDSCVTELHVQTNDETVSYPFNIICLDFIYRDKEDKDHISELRLDKNLDYRSCEFYLDKLKVELNPFCWNSCEFTVDKIETPALASWVIKWLRIDEEFSSKHLAEAIHSCSQPYLIDNKYLFTIDFGSAPETCFVEFLQFLSDNNVEEVFIETSEV